jgi:glycosyltransferase involved in cell wall biosynthesis
MKILFITDLYPLKSGETASPRTLHNFVLEWIKQNHVVDVIKPNFIFNSMLRGKKFYKNGFYEFEGVKILNANYFSPFLFDIEKKLAGKLDLNKYTLQEYDLIIAHMPSGIIFANKLFEKYKSIVELPVVCGVHSSDVEVLTNPVYKFYFKKQLEQAYHNAKKIACRSFVLQKKFTEMFPNLAEKTFVAASGVKTTVRTKSSPLTKDTSTVKVLTCANLIKRKNVDKLILSMRGLDGFVLKIAGDGVELGMLKKLVAQNKLENRVEFLGKLSQKEVFTQMQNSHLFVLPSVSETFGMVYLEAMENGCVTVCTKNDGIDGIIIDGENGFLTEPTPEGIKKTLIRIKNFETLDKIVENSLETIKNYTPEICADNYLKNCQG